VGGSESGGGTQLRSHPRSSPPVCRDCPANAEQIAACGVATLATPQAARRIIMPFDVVTFGEAMIRLAPPNFRRLEQAQTLDVQVGGAELNTAVGLARLGRSAAWVSRLTRNPLGRLVANKAREAGVNADHVVW